MNTFNEIVDFYVNITPGLKSSLIITVVLMISTTIIGLRVRRLKPTDVPGGITLISIFFVEGINDSMTGFFKNHWRIFTPYMMTYLIFLLFANTASLFGLHTPLSSINVAVGFSVLAFVSIQVAAIIVKNPFRRMKDLLDPNPVFLPINIIGEISTPFAMGMRLFGNLLSGSIIGIIVYGITGWFGIIFGAFFIHPVFDMFFGAIQAYVYFMLFSVFLSMAVEE